MQQLSLSDGRNRPDRPKDRSRHLSIDPNKVNRVRPPLRLAPPQRKRSDIDPQLPQSAPDLTDNPRLIAVPQIKDGALELRLQRNPFDLQHARRTIVENRAFRRKTCR